MPEDKQIQEEFERLEMCDQSSTGCSVTLAEWMRNENMEILIDFLISKLKAQAKATEQRCVKEMIENLQTFRGVMGKFNCGKDCEVSKAFYRLIDCEIEALTNSITKQRK